MKDSIFTKQLKLLFIFILMGVTLMGGMKSSKAQMSLPFDEDWSSESFETNGWSFDDPEQSNWTIDLSGGNPLPSAQFHYQPGQTNYSISLLSPDLDATNVTGTVTLEFDLKHSYYAATGNELMVIQVFDGTDWVEIDSFDNTEDLPWTTFSYDITDLASGEITQVRFEATGEDTYNINYWKVDNIHVYAEGTGPLSLPFNEDWSSESFDTNSWTFDPSQANWGIDLSSGNPEPSAKFSYNPSLSDYSISLISPQLNATNVTGTVFLEFDLEHSTYAASGNELMKIHVYNGSEWIEVATFDNSEDIPWSTFSYEITDLVLGEITQVKFEATGVTTYDINYWKVDNINVYSEGTSPMELPFIEDWISESFETNNWTFDPSQGNWGIDLSSGNPEPTSEFSYNPTQNNYSISMISPQLDATSSSGTINLAFDLKHSTYAATGNELLVIHVFNGSEWVEVTSFDNSSDIPWTTYNYDITDIAAGQITQVKFEATGVSSNDINYWKVDNIEVSESETVSQSIALTSGYQFISTYIVPDNPDMMAILDPLLDASLDFVRSSSGDMFRKVGDTWINGIGDWQTTEGYLFKMNDSDELSIEGELIEPQTEIDLNVGYQFVSYLNTEPLDGLEAFSSILNDNLDFIRNSAGNQIRKIGDTWVNNIGDAVPGEGYLIKMFNADELVYPEIVKSATKESSPKAQHFIFQGGNAADPIYTLYLEGELNKGDEVAAFANGKMVGSTVISSENALQNELPVFATLNSGKGFEAGQEIELKVWDAENGNTYNTGTQFNNPYGDAYVSRIYPAEDGEYSIAEVTKSGLAMDEAHALTATIYPNPANDLVTLETVTGEKEISIYNYTGKVVYESRTSNGQLEIDVSGFDAGIYVVRITFDDAVISKQVVVK